LSHGQWLKKNENDSFEDSSRFWRSKTVSGEVKPRFWRSKTEVILKK
jgi:hypothetical protein